MFKIEIKFVRYPKSDAVKETVATTPSRLGLLELQGLMRRRGVEPTQIRLVS